MPQAPSLHAAGPRPVPLSPARPGSFGVPLSTRCFIARPTESGYDGIYVHLDGDPSQKLPLLLAAYRYRFGQDVEAMTRHLIDDVAVGWDELGTDLLDDAPPALVNALTGGEHWPSRTLDHLVTPDGSPPVRMSVTDTTAGERTCSGGTSCTRRVSR